MYIKNRKILIFGIFISLLSNVSYSKSLISQFLKLKNYVPQFLKHVNQSKKDLFKSDRINFKQFSLKNLRPSSKQVLIGLGVAVAVAVAYSSVAKVVTNFRKKLIHKASRAGSLFRLKMLLLFNKKKYINAGLMDKSYSDYDKRTALQFACMNGHYEIAKYLVNNGANVNERIYSYQKSPLEIIYEQFHLENTEMIRFLVEHGANIEDNVLCSAFKRNKMDIVRYFVENGANPNAHDANGNTLLYHALKQKNYEICDYLIEHGADINAINSERKSLLHIACENDDFESLSYLIQKGVNINANHRNIGTALHIVYEKNNPLIVNILIEKGADLNATCDKYGTVLHLACEKSDYEFVETLIENGADIGAVCYKYGTLLHVACQNRDYKMIEYLIGKGIDIDVTCERYGTILHLACKNGDSEMVEYLVKKGANVNKKHFGYKIPLHIAHLNGHYNIVKFLAYQKNALRRKIIGEKLLHEAVKKGDLGFISYLIGNGVDIDAKSEKSETCLSIAVKKNLVNLVSFLIANKANVNIEIDDEPLLNIACERGFNSIVKLLLLGGADPNGGNFFGKTPLHIACENNFHEIIELLVESGADVNARSRYQKIEYIEVDETETRRGDGYLYLVKVKALKPKTIYFYKTPLQIAEYKKDNQMLNILLKRNEDRSRIIHARGGLRKFYEDLGLPLDASNRQIKQKYYKLVKIWHPDTVKDNYPDIAPEEALKKIQVINQAYEILCPKSKKIYKKFL